MGDIGKSLFSDRNQEGIGNNCQDYESQVCNMFKNLSSSWKEESYNQLSNIINSYDKVMQTGISELVKEVCDLKTQLSETTNTYSENYATILDERNVLIETVKNLKDEIRQLNDKLLIPRSPSYSVDNEQNMPESKHHVIRQNSKKNKIYMDETDEENNELRNENACNEEVSRQSVEDLQIKSVVQEGRNGSHLNTSPNMSAQSEIHRCAECNFSFSSEMNLIIHMGNVHSKDIMFKCEVCPYQTHFNSNLQMHKMNVHEKEKEFKLADKKFESETPKTVNSRKEGSMVSKDESDETMEQGEEAPVSTTSKEDKIFRCDICPWSTFFNGEMANDRIMDHIKECKVENKKPTPDGTKCYECNKVYKNKRSLYAHKYDMHQSNPKEHICPQCGSQFSYKKNLNCHIRKNCRAKKSQAKDDQSANKPPPNMNRRVGTLWRKQNL